jgi:hypothetical protein
MSEQSEPTELTESSYPLGRGYGHDYMRGGEVLGGYGYSQRAEYERRRGEADGQFEGEERRRRPEAPPEAGESRAPVS